MYRFVKRTIDFLLSLILILALSPALILISFAIRLTSPGPALFKQKRVGIHKTDASPFTNSAPCAPTRRRTHRRISFSDPARFITPVGKFLRATSLDELPQLFNILKGENGVRRPAPRIVESG